MKKTFLVFYALIACGVFQTSIARAEHTVDIVGHVASQVLGATHPGEKRARPNDLAASYWIHEGTLYRSIRNRNNVCAITTNVTGFKISEHPNDAALIYFTKLEHGQENLYVLNNGNDNGECPPAVTTRIVRNVKKYNVVSSRNTTVVNTALTDGGNFTAWDNQRVVLSLNNIRDYSLNSNYGVAGAPFNSYVAFAIDSNGHIWKIKGRDVADSKADTSKPYASVEDFKQEKGIE